MTDSNQHADTVALVPAEEPGGMTWQEVKDFLDHIRTTCMDERQELKLEVRRLRQENEELRYLATVMAQELAKWGWGDFHYGPQPQDRNVVAVLEEYRRVLHTDGSESGVTSVQIDGREA